MKFHQEIVKDELHWAYLSDLKNAVDIADKRAEHEAENQQRMLAVMSKLSSDTEQERHSESTLLAALSGLLIYTGAQERSSAKYYPGYARTNIRVCLSGTGIYEKTAQQSGCLKRQSSSLGRKTAIELNPSLQSPANLLCC